jgi:hypothetical protein
VASVLKFPALFQEADDASGRAQKEYLRLVKVEYALLLLAAVLAMRVFEASTAFLIGYAMVFVASLVVMLLRTLGKPEQDWYRCRALAESVKTSTWRYAMRAAPFDGVSKPDPRTEFCEFLEAIFEANRHVGHRMTAAAADADQITPEMDEIRAKPLTERIAFYLSDRIRDQRQWYVRKALANQKSVRVWIFICVAVYLGATASVLIRILEPAWPSEPLIVVASSIIGWMQIKKFSELSSAYTLTAHEIGISEGRIGAVQTDEAFSDFVNQTELAFSREHTQWVARQAHA